MYLCLTRLNSHQFASFIKQGLNVVSQEVIDIELESSAADGRQLVEASMRSVPVVLVDPRGEVVESVGGVLVEPSVGPFSDSGLDKSFRLTVGAGSVDASADMFDGEVSASLSKERGIETGSVVGHDPSNMDTEPSEISHGLVKEGGRRGSFFIRKHGGVGDAGVVIHGDVKKLPTRAPGLIAWIAGNAVAWLNDASQLLNVDMQQIAGRAMFIADDGYLRLQHLDLVQLQPGQYATH